MATLQVDTQYGKHKSAVEDARKMQVLVRDECRQSGREPPPYTLQELIGKGSFGRVYKASEPKSTRPVAVKIISIEEGDSIMPGAADTFNDILKEVHTLKLLSSSGARNINNVIDAFLVGHSMWMVTEYCAGGSVATLMRPTGGLHEQWIVPILREVAEAIFWVHKQGIIHRDIKCANVLIAEAGGVQLCDFGVAGIIETKFDKRRTVTGTLHWMAPELFDPSVSYGTEIDIWAFGSMAYEMATGLPPNATSMINVPEFGSYLRQNCPRLQGNRFSPGLKNLVASCMVQDPKQRPSVKQIKLHPYVADSEGVYPTASLSRLVHAYRLWQAQGGIRTSLFSAGGAQGNISESSSPSDEWDFDTIRSDQLTFDGPDAQVVYDVYGSGVDYTPHAAPPRGGQRRRRRGPPNVRPVIGPLEKVFDPNTITSYHDNARIFYGKQPPPPEPPVSDLPLRDDSLDPSVRESLIDLDGSLGDDDGGLSRLSRFADLETIKPGVVPHLTSPTDMAKRRTQDWTFPVSTPTSAVPDMPTLRPRPRPPTFRESLMIDLDGSFEGDDLSRYVDLDSVRPSLIRSQSTGPDESRDRRTRDWTFPTSTPASMSPELPAHRPHSTEPGEWGPKRRTQDWSFPASTPVSTSPDLPAFDTGVIQRSFSGLAPAGRLSTLSLIDLDEGLSTSVTRDSDLTGADARDGYFGSDWAERLETPSTREPSIYVTSDMSSSVSQLTQGSDDTDPSSPTRHKPAEQSETPPSIQFEPPHPWPPRPSPTMGPWTPRRGRFAGLPPPPLPPSLAVMQGSGPKEEMKHELSRLISSLNHHLKATTTFLESSRAETYS